MRRAGISPDGYVLPVVVRAAFGEEELLLVSAFHGEGVKFCVDAVGNVHVGNALVNGYASCGEIENARTVFDEMPLRDVTSWNSMISGYVSSGAVVLALELVR